jgi:hypothetical protein
MESLDFDELNVDPIPAHLKKYFFVDKNKPNIL